MTLITCTGCGECHYLADSCPHCLERPRQARSRTAILLGLGLAACGDAKEDSAIYDVQALYGDAMVGDYDGDGWPEGEDCDDEDANVHPEAEETPGDGIDSNCNDEDDS
jgi:hypothetical protein